MSITVSNCQHCDKQQFRTLSWVHCTIFSVAKLNLFMRALLLDGILAIETRCTRGVRVVFSVEKMRSSNSARMNGSFFEKKKKY